MKAVLGEDVSRLESGCCAVVYATTRTFAVMPASRRTARIALVVRVEMGLQCSELHHAMATAADAHLGVATVDRWLAAAASLDPDTGRNLLVVGP